MTTPAPTLPPLIVIASLSELPDDKTVPSYTATSLDEALAAYRRRHQEVVEKVWQYRNEYHIEAANE